VNEPATTALITFLSALGTFVSLAVFMGRRLDRLDEKVDRLDEKFDRRFDVLMVELLRQVREGHGPNAAA
jgi:hypothetical protein